MSLVPQIYYMLVSCMYRLVVYTMSEKILKCTTSSDCHRDLYQLNYHGHHSIVKDQKLLCRVVYMEIYFISAHLDLCA